MVRRRRARGLPHLWRHPKSLVYYMVRQVHGRPVRKSLRTREYVTATNEIEAAIRDHAAGEAWNTPDDLTLTEAAREWLELKAEPRFDLSVRTLNEYRTTVERLEELLPVSAPVQSVTPRDLRKLLTAYEARWPSGPRGTRRIQSHLSMLFRWLIKEGVLTRNPVEALDAVRVPQRDQHCITPEDYATLLASLDGDIAGEQGPLAARDALTVRELVEVLWFSGLRSIEAYRLVWEDVDLEGATWVIRSPANKGGVRRHPVHPAAIDVLRRRRLRGLSVPFSLYPTQNAWIRFKRRHRAFRGWSLHALRRGFISRLVAAGNLAAARHLGRHRTPAMTDLYTTVGSETFRAALEAL